MMTEVKERPILLGQPWVKAILDGRKTQTRRVVKPPPPDWIDRFGYTAFTPAGAISGRGRFRKEGPAEKFFQSPYGVPGDRLWVRETFCPRTNLPISMLLPPYYAADGDKLPGGWVWKPSIHMPRSASRINLEITEVRVERLQELSKADAIAEGLYQWTDPPRITATHYGIDKPDVWETDPRMTFARLWDQLGAHEAFRWAANPWVWVVGFQRSV